MNTKATYLGGRPVAEANKALPDGTYSGIWGGYEVWFILDGWRHTFRTEGGVRGTRVPCMVTISGGGQHVEVTT